jgi:hypothetical protein
MLDQVQPLLSRFDQERREQLFWLEDDVVKEIREILEYP